MVKLRMRDKINVQRVIYKVVGTVLALWVGGEVIGTLDDTMNISTFNCTGDGSQCYDVFWSGFSFLGLDGNETAGISTTGILSVIGIVAAAAIILEFVELSM